MNDKRETLKGGTDGSADVRDRTESHSEPHDARRRALIAGLIAAPAVLTLMNRSVWAAAGPGGPPEDPGLNCSIALSLSASHGQPELTEGQIRACEAQEEHKPPPPH